jgi:cephalosporin hydroxylase
MIKPIIKKILSDRQRVNLRARFAKNDLSRLAQLYGTDKFGSHFYTTHYQRHLGHLKNKPVTLLEIGIGGWTDGIGYADGTRGGSSLRMWKAFFPRGRIYGLDIQDKSFHDEPRIKTFQGSQDDENFLRKVVGEIGAPDIVIDDGSHYTHHVIKSFEVLFPLLKTGGIYAVEDLQASYWHSTADEDWNGSEDLAAPHTSMNFFKKLVDGLNYEEFRHAHEPTYYDRNIVAMHFYHNLLFIEKGLNNEGSNLVKK